MVQKCMGGRGSTPTSKGEGSEGRRRGDGRGGKEKEGEGKWYPHLEESFALEGTCLPFLYWIMAS